MLTPRQTVIAKIMTKRSANPQQFNAYVEDQCAGRTVNDREFRTIIDKALALSRNVSSWLKDAG